MKKIYLLTKITFHTSNIGLIFIYLYPGSILGKLFYDDFAKQPQLASDFIIFSSNHFFAFMFLSFLGLLSYYKSKIKILFLYIFCISIFLELTQILIPQRSFQFQDLLGNFFGFFFIFILFNLYQFVKSINEY